MIIHAPTLSERNNQTQIAARVELQHRTKAMPSELWFRFSTESAPGPSLDIDPFGVGLLLLAMQNNEPMYLRGTLSQKLLAGMNQYQDIYHSWYPTRFHKIDILPAGLREDPVSSSFAEACAFSGGVDSFYTFLKLKQNSSHELTHRTHKLTHTLFMAGFDMPLNLGHSIRELVTSYTELMQQSGIGFVTGSTNIRNFVNTVDWTNAHGQALAASALFFKSSWNRFYIPSSYTAGSYPKWGTHPLLDHHLSTESLEFSHHGQDLNRVKKLALIAQASESYSRLRVCWIQDIGLRNCGRCEKCIRTMTSLEIIGALPRYRTFGIPKLNLNLIRNLPQRTHQGRLFARELIREALLRMKFKVALALVYSLVRTRIRRKFRKKHHVISGNKFQKKGHG